MVNFLPPGVLGFAGERVTASTQLEVNGAHISLAGSAMPVPCGQRHAGLTERMTRRNGELAARTGCGDHVGIVGGSKIGPPSLAYRNVTMSA
jgi:hypothetical protein